MQRTIIIAIIIILIIIVFLGLYFVFMGLNNGTVTPGPDNNGGNTSFDIQGMKVQILQQGSGAGAKAGDSVTVNYVGTLENETTFDSSISRNAPFTFPLGQGRVIKGWDLGIIGMKAGEKRTLVIPADLAYGENGFPPVIPKNATLKFEVELLKIN